MVFALSALAAEPKPKSAPASAAADRPLPRSSFVNSVAKFCDPACELRAQDSAFNLLVESFRQHQSYQIDHDYQGRIRQISAVKEDRAGLVVRSESQTMRTLRQLMLGLAQQEREVRMAELETRVSNFEAAYTCVRKIDEDYVGEKVPKKTGREEARAMLKTFVAFKPGSIAGGDFAHARAVPASSVLANPPAEPPIAEQLVESCE
jgi:hypothetical protein